MERLTERLKNGQAGVRGCGNDCKYDFNYCDNYLEDCPTINEIYEKLANYEELEEQGKLLKPKCLPGDYVWEVNKERNIISEYEVTSIRYGINKTFHYMWTLRDGIYGDLDGFRDGEIGKTVFLTEGEARTALEGMEDTHGID